MNVRLKAIAAIALVVSFGAVSASAHERAGAASDQAIIVAKVLKVKYIKDLEPAYPGDIPLGSVFQVRISRPQIVKGEFPDRVRDLLLTATHKEVLQSRERIAILVESRAGEVSVVTWTDVFSAACFPSELAQEGRLRDRWDYTEKHSVSEGLRTCVYLGD